MKKLTLLLLCMFFLVGCEKQTDPQTYIISGTIVKIHHLYSTDIVIETEDGTKVSVYEGRFSDFTYGLTQGDKVCFEVEKIDGGGYKIIGFGLDNK